MRAMFSTVAPRYDFITRAFSYGMDRRWKQYGVERAVLAESAVVLDLASGTGDFSRIVRERRPRVRTVAVDLTEGMLRLARSHTILDSRRFVQDLCNRMFPGRRVHSSSEYQIGKLF